MFKEFKYFASQPLNVRTLLVTNMLFAMVLPLVNIFAGAYVLRATGNDTTILIAFQLCMYIGVVLSALGNGLLMKWFKSATLYAFGILISSVSLIVLMFLKNPSNVVICTAGLFIGLATGFFWTNRYLLTLYATDDENRNYFFGLESLFFTLWNIVIPIVAGLVIAFTEDHTLFGWDLTADNGYQFLTILALIISICACFVLARGKFQSPANMNYFHFRFHILWKKMLGLASLKGMVEGFIVTVPTILIFKFIGNEGSLGLIQGVSGAVTAIVVYILGRVAKPQHRMAIFGAGLAIFFLGTLANCVLFSAAGAFTFIICNVMFQPLRDLAYFPTMMKTIDTVKVLEDRDEYTYIMSHEFGLFAGRAFGMLLFIILAFAFGEGGADIALRWAVLIVGAVQLISLPLAKSILKDIDTKYTPANEN
ncbi:MAG: MFS transporter [Bacteroidales bacterium]|nr:MFS transporter [Bacteroidales bacterium]